MRVSEVIEKIGLKVLNELWDKEIEGAIVSDMVSDVMAWAKPGNIWVTVQTHKNVIAAANLVDISAVIITHGKTVLQDTLEMANRVEISILSTDLFTYELVGKLHEAGV